LPEIVEDTYLTLLECDKYITNKILCAEQTTKNCAHIFFNEYIDGLSANDRESYLKGTKMGEINNAYVQNIKEQGIQQGKDETLAHVAEKLLKDGLSRQYVKKTLGVTEKWLKERVGHFKRD
jgi:hypothetical protein